MDDERPRSKMVTQYFIIRDTIRIDPDNNAFAVVGSLREIGCWDTSKCVIATQSQKYLHTWVATVKLPAHSFFEWKWVVVSSDGSQVYRWEERDNQKSVTGKMDGCFKNSWNEWAYYENGTLQAEKLLIQEDYRPKRSKKRKQLGRETSPVVTDIKNEPLSSDAEKDGEENEVDTATEKENTTDTRMVNGDKERSDDETSVTTVTKTDHLPLEAEKENDVSPTIDPIIKSENTIDTQIVNTNQEQPDQEKSIATVIKNGHFLSDADKDSEGNDVSPPIDATIHKEDTPNIQMVNVDKEERPDMRTITSPTISTCFSSESSKGETTFVDKEEITNNIDFTKDDVATLDTSNKNDDILLNIANDESTAQNTESENGELILKTSGVINSDLSSSDVHAGVDSVKPSSEILIDEKIVTESTAQTMQLQETTGTAQCNASEDESEEFLSFSESVPVTCLKTDQIEIPTAAENSTSGEIENNLNISDLEVGECLGRNVSETKMPICDIMEQEQTTNLNTQVCDNREISVSSTENKSAILDFIRRETFAVSQQMPLPGAFAKTYEHAPETLPVNKVEDISESDDSPNLDSDVKFPETEDSEPLLTSTNTESVEESKTGNAQRGECDSYFSRLFDWACNIL